MNTFSRWKRDIKGNGHQEFFQNSVGHQNESSKTMHFLNRYRSIFQMPRYKKAIMEQKCVFVEQKLRCNNDYSYCLQSYNLHIDLFYRCKVRAKQIACHKRSIYSEYPVLNNASETSFLNHTNVCHFPPRPKLLHRSTRNESQAPFHEPRPTS